MAKTAQAVIETKVKDGASAGFQKFRNEMKKTEKQGKVLNQQFRFMRGGLGQVGHQVQDIAVQLQMGQNAMLVFGQQGSQIASLFGPQGAMIGAFLAVGAALSMALLPRLVGASEGMKELRQEAKNLTDRYDELTGAAKEYAKILATEAILEYKKDIKDLEDELKAGIKTYTSAKDGITIVTESVEDFARRSKQAEGEIVLLNEKIAEMEKATDGVTTEFEKQQKRLKDQIATFNLASQAVTAYKIGMDELTGAISSQEAAELLSLNNILAGKIEAHEEQKRLDKERKKEIKAFEKDVEKSLKAQERTAQRFADTVGDGFVNAISGAMSFKDAMKNVARSVVNDLIRMIVKKQITDKIFGIIMNTTTFKPEQAANLQPSDIPINIPIDDSMMPSANGGGFTGFGSRSGGVDGKGGFPAILHPNETVLDHTKGQRMGNVINQTINVTTGVQQTVRAEIQNLMPQIQEAAKAAVADSRMRGGNFSKAVRGA